MSKRHSFRSVVVLIAIIAVSAFVVPPNWFSSVSSAKEAIGLVAKSATPVMSDNSNWMGDMLAYSEAFGNIPINRVVLAGSHDSGTYEMGQSARTQNLSIAEQLKLGIRYFDLRPKVHNSVFYIHHGILASDTHLGKWPAPANLDAGTEIFAQIRAFLKMHPDEILILKFQDFQNFGHDDYMNFTMLLKQYVTFNVTSPVKSRCAPVTLDQATKAYLNRQTMKTLVDSGERVFAFFEVKDVPTNEPEIWKQAWHYSPSKTMTKYALWDPFWEDFSSSLADDKPNEVRDRWFPWHKTNLTTWRQDGFFVMQSQMQVLHGTDSASGYFNKAERSAKATYNLSRDSNGRLISNNERNANQFMKWAREGQILNVIAFDYIEYGGLCDKIVEYYKEKLATQRRQ